MKYIHFTVSRSGASLPRIPPRTFSCMPHFACAAHPALSPLAGCESHDSSLLGCAGSKLNFPTDHPERPASSSAAAGAPRGPIRLLGPALSLRRSALLARRRPARDSLNGSRRARAPRLPAIRERSRRARLFACTCRLPRRGLWVCALCVSCRVSMYVLLGTCGISTD